MATTHVVALSTFPSAEVAAEVARALVTDKLAACVNVVPALRSVYRWKGQICEDAEALCVIKTRSDHVDALKSRLLALHPYELPELVVLDITSGHGPYLSWIDDSLA